MRSRYPDSIAFPHVVKTAMDEQLRHRQFEKMADVFYAAISRGTDFHCNVIDRDYRIVWHNHVPNEARKTGQYCFEFYQKRSARCAECPVAVVFASGESCTLERRRYERLPNGLPRWGEIRAHPIFDPNGLVEFVLTIGFDITGRKSDLARQEKYMLNLERRLRALLEIPSDSAAGLTRKSTPDRLTRRELTVLKLMAEGFSNSEIAGILSLSPHTVKSHTIHIFNKLGVNDRTEAAVAAARLGLID